MPERRAGAARGVHSSTRAPIKSTSAHEQTEYKHFGRIRPVDSVRSTRRQPMRDAPGYCRKGVHGSCRGARVFPSPRVCDSTRPVCQGAAPVMQRRGCPRQRPRTPSPPLPRRGNPSSSPPTHRPARSRDTTAPPTPTRPRTAQRIRSPRSPAKQRITDSNQPWQYSRVCRFCNAIVESGTFDGQPRCAPDAPPPPQT